MIKHILSADGFTREFLAGIFQHARNCAKRKMPTRLAQHSAAALFYMPSTRTMGSFQSAFMRLGMPFSTVSSVDESSMAKGETLEDTIRMQQNYVNLIVLRHPNAGAAELAASVSDVPVINAGDGTNEHPTQTAVDMYTIEEELGRLTELTFTIIGDHKNGRTVHSLLKTICRYYPKEVRLISSPMLKASPELLIPFRARGIRVIECENMEDNLHGTNVVYMTRIQKEWLTDEEYAQVKNFYCFEPKHFDMIDKEGILLHPMPMRNEVDRRCDLHPRAAYLRQAARAAEVRMALVEWCLNI